jgi:hypothetical protein
VSVARSPDSVELQRNGRWKALGSCAGPHTRCPDHPA